MMLKRSFKSQTNLLFSLLLSFLFSLVICALLTNCTAPRSVLLSPDALPKGQFQAGANFDVNIPSQTSKALYGSMEKGIGTLVNRASGDSAITPISAKDLNQFSKGLLAYSLDPLGPQMGLFIRYGIWPRFDLGYHRAGGVNAYEFRYQVLGPLATDTLAASSDWRASIGMQYSSQSYELPSVAGLDKLQSLLRFEFNRKDILVPIVFGKPIGKQGKYGSFGLGVVYNFAFVDYGSQILKLVEEVSPGVTKPFDPIQGEKKISSYGAFTNGRFGYRWLYLVGSMACYYQDYGEFKVFGGESLPLSGWTIIPTLGLEFRI
jgi:hypothetical protein